MRDRDRFRLADDSMVISSMSIGIGLALSSNKEISLSTKWYNLSRESFFTGEDVYSIDDQAGTQCESSKVQRLRYKVTRLYV